MASDSRARNSPAGVSVSLARSSAEVAAAYDLAARVFGPSYFDARAHKQALLEDVEPLESVADVVVARDRNTVVGIIRLVERRLRFGNDLFGVGGITSVAVDPRYQNVGVGGALMRVAMRESRRRGNDLSVLFARRAVDGWYPRFGFLGLGQHVQCQVTAAEGSLPGSGQSGRHRWASGYLPRAAATYRAMYESAYRLLPGVFVRPASWWNRLGARLQLRRGLEFLTLYERREPRAYAVLDGDRVVEVGGAARHAPAVASTLVEELRRRADTSPVFALHPSHPVMQAIYAGNHTLSVRRAWDGGHMAAPLNASAASRLRAHGLGSVEKHGKADDIRVWPVWSALDEF